MSSQEFSASDEELQLCTRLLEKSNWHQTDTLSVDAAIGIFKQSGLTFKQLRDILTIADKKGSGNLSKHELAVVIRLMGWVQAGAPLDKGLLASAGPIPFIKGITNSIVRSSSRQTINGQISPINPVDVRRFEVAFNDANPVLGILDREQVIMTLLRNDMSYNSAKKIMDLAGESHKKIDFPKFALALHLGDLLQSSKITSLPSAIPQHLRDQFSHLKTPDSPLPPPSATLSNYSVSSTRTLTPKQVSHLKTPDSPLPPPSPTLPNYYVSSTLTPEQSPAKLEEVDLPSKLESDLRWVKSEIEKKWGY